MDSADRRKRRCRSAATDARSTGYSRPSPNRQRETRRAALRYRRRTLRPPRPAPQQRDRPLKLSAGADAAATKAAAAAHAALARLLRAATPEHEVERINFGNLREVRRR